jgi:hypothetical protein
MSMGGLGAPAPRAQAAAPMGAPMPSTMSTRAGGYASPPMELEESCEAPPELSSLSTNRPAPPPAAPSSMPPPAPPAPKPAPQLAKGRKEREVERERAISVPDAPYRERLVRIAEAIDAALAGAPAQLASALAMALVRLNEWLEDARSVGLDALVTAATPIAEQLAHAVRDDQARNAGATEAARRLRELATGTTPAPTPTKSRLAFWK